MTLPEIAIRRPVTTLMLLVSMIALGLVALTRLPLAFMPDIVEFYTGERPILQNVPTWRCMEEDALKYVLDNLSELVVKDVHGSGGYGMLIGPTSSKKEIASFEKKLREKPENYIAQPTLSLSTVPVFTQAGLAPRHFA